MRQKASQLKRNGALLAAVVALVTAPSASFADNGSATSTGGIKVGPIVTLRNTHGGTGTIGCTAQAGGINAPMAAFIGTATPGPNPPTVAITNTLANGTVLPGFGFLNFAKFGIGAGGALADRSVNGTISQATGAGPLRTSATGSASSQAVVAGIGDAVSLSAIASVFKASAKAPAGIGSGNSVDPWEFYNDTDESVTVHFDIVLQNIDLEGGLPAPPVMDPVPDQTVSGYYADDMFECSFFVLRPATAHSDGEGTVEFEAGYSLDSDLNGELMSDRYEQDLPTGTNESFRSASLPFLNRDITIEPGETVTLSAFAGSAAASEPDAGDEYLDWSVSGPDWVEIDGNGDLFGDAPAPGDYAVTLTATDTRSRDSASRSFTLHVVAE